MYKEKITPDNMIIPLGYHQKRLLKKQEEYDSIQLRLKNYEKSQIELDSLKSELDDIHLKNEISKVDKISDEEYHEIYKKLIEMETKTKKLWKITKHTL